MASHCAERERRRLLRVSKRRLKAQAARYSRIAVEYEALALEARIELATVERDLDRLR